jgi:Raf kinase inhibitor-like YbhB/YbcL family protein
MFLSLFDFATIMKIAYLCVLMLLVACVPEQSEVNTMKLTSSAFVESGKIPSVHTCDGDDIAPVLLISDVPTGAKSLALVMDDPDAVKPAGKVWDHWIVWNIPPGTTHIDGEPSGVHGKGTSGNLEYHGPCPPDREHRYYFKLYALDVLLDLPEGSTKTQVEDVMKGHVVAEARLMGRYERRK